MVRRHQPPPSVFSPILTVDTKRPPSVAIPPPSSRPNEQEQAGQESIGSNDDDMEYSRPSAENEKNNRKEIVHEGSVDSRGENQYHDAAAYNPNVRQKEEDVNNINHGGDGLENERFDEREETEPAEDDQVASDGNAQLWLHPVSAEDAAQLPSSFDYLTLSDCILSARCPSTLHINAKNGFVPAGLVPTFRTLQDNYNATSWLRNEPIHIDESGYAQINYSTMMAAFPRKPSRGVCGIMVFQHDEFAIDRVFWFVEHVEPNVTNHTSGSYWLHFLTRMWSADDHEQMDIYRKKHLQRMLIELRKPANGDNTLEIQILNNYLRGKGGTFSLVEEVKLLLKVYHWSLGMPVTLLQGNHQLLPGKRLCEGPSAYRVVHGRGRISNSSTGRHSRQFKSTIILFEHQRRDTTGRQYIRTIDLLLPPPPTNRTHFLQTDFWPSTVKRGYVPRYEPCFFYEGPRTLTHYGVKFYPLSGILDPNELRPSLSTQTLQDWEVLNTLSLERAIMQSFLDPCYHSVPQYTYRDRTMISAARGLFHEMTEHYGDNSSPHRHHRLNMTELIEPEKGAGVAVKVNIYSRILRRRIIIFALNPNLTMRQEMMQQPPPGINIQWPFLFVGYCGDSTSVRGNQRRRIFAPSCFCGEDRPNEFPNTGSTPCPKQTPDFLFKSKTFEQLEPLPHMEPAYHIRADIDGLTVLTNRLVQLASTFVGTNYDQSMHPSISIRRLIKPSTKAAVCRFDAQLWEITDKGVTTRTPISPHANHDGVVVYPKGKCNLLHLPTIWIGTILCGSIS
jgi:hypothetical protein